MSSIGETSAVAVPPKLGVATEDGEIAVVIDTLADLARIAPGVQKGQRIAVPVRVFPQRNGRGLRYVWTGRLDTGDRGGWA